jgi:integrase/recombinase XerD
MTTRCPPYGYRHFMHADQPMRIEREAYLAHLAERGASYNYLKLVAGYLLHAVHIMDLQQPRQFTREEVVQAGKRWATYKGPYRQPTPRPAAPAPFVRHTLQWFRFLNCLPAGPRRPFEDLLHQFGQAMIAERSLSSLTVEGYRDRLLLLMCWLRNHRVSLSTVCMRDIDEFLDEKRSSCGNAALASYCQAMRTFFAWAEKRHLCPAGLPIGIKSPDMPSFFPAIVLRPGSRYKNFSGRSRVTILLSCVQGRSSCSSPLTA